MTKIVYEIRGGLYLCYHGYTPKCELKDFDGEFGEVIKDIAWDSDTAPGQGRDLPRYIVIDEEVPEIFESVNDYIRDWNYYRTSLINFNKYEHLALPLSVKREIYLITRKSIEWQYAIHDLLKVKSMRSEFRKSLFSQLMEWLKHPGDRKYELPFSNRQLQSLIKYRQQDIHYATKERSCNSFIPQKPFELVPVM